MKLSMLQENLVKALDCAALVKGKTSLPILQNVKIRAAGYVDLSMTNLETWLTVRTGAKVETDGEATVPVRVLRGYVKTLPDSKLDIEWNAETLRLTCGEKSAKFKGIDAQEFPVFPDLPERAGMADGDTLQVALKACLASKVTNKNYYQAYGDVVKLDAHGDTLTLTATGGQIFTTRQVPLYAPAEFTGYAARSTLDTLAKVITIANRGKGKHNRVSVEFGANDKGIAFTVEGITVYGAWQDVKFPELKTIAPVAFCEVDTKDLVQALKVVKCFFPSVTFSANGRLKIRGGCAEVGYGTAILGKSDDPRENAYYKHTGKPFRFEAQAAAVLNALNNMPERVTLGFTDKDTPVKVTAGESEAFFSTLTT